MSKKMLKYYDHYFKYFKVMENISKMLSNMLSKYFKNFLEYLMAGDSFKFFHHSRRQSPVSSPS